MLQLLYYQHLPENKKIYLVFVGQMSEEDNKEIIESIIQYFESGMVFR